MGSSRRRCFFAKTQPSANPVPFPLASNMRGLALEAAGAAVKGQGERDSGGRRQGRGRQYDRRRRRPRLECDAGSRIHRSERGHRRLLGGGGALEGHGDRQPQLAFDDLPRSLAHFERAAAPS